MYYYKSMLITFMVNEEFYFYETLHVQIYHASCFQRGHIVRSLYYQHGCLTYSNNIGFPPISFIYGIRYRYNLHSNGNISRSAKTLIHFTHFCLNLMSCYAVSQDLETTRQRIAKIPEYSNHICKTNRLTISILFLVIIQMLFCTQFYKIDKLAYKQISH